MINDYSTFFQFRIGFYIFGYAKIKNIFAFIYYSLTIQQVFMIYIFKYGFIIFGKNLKI